MLPLINNLNLCGQIRFGYNRSIEPHTPAQIARLMQLLDESIADASEYEESTWDELAV